MQRGVPRQAEKLPPNYIPRPRPFNAVKTLLLNGTDTATSTLVVSAIYGLGGIGKSVLAAALAADIEIQERFPDGTLWITLGQNPDLLPMLGSWIQALGDYKYQPLTPDAASSHLRTLLYDRQMLLIVDDVWNPAHLEPFRVGNQNSCVLVTTRGAPISGAKKYDLDVMTPEQAMELLTHQLSTPLTPEDQQLAAAFAKRVGYLPLALELATAQIEEDLSWDELLTDFETEVERLDVLDKVCKDDIPNDEIRRKYSLIACFNLSLKSLTPDQQTYFAWLGVLPEDADITKRIAKTLWQLTARQAGNVLKAFRTKGLLKGERPTYRLHDLMHDLAVQLLRGPVHPDGEALKGLGKPLPDAHQHLLALYQQQTNNHQWHTLEDDGHIYDYLTWHIEQSECPHLIHQLFQETTDKGRNGWYEACERVGKPGLFASDLARAWQLTLNTPLTANDIIPLQVRYAFIRASLNSLADNIPAPMVSGLLKVGLWQPAQALAYAQQTYNPWRRAEYLMALVPHMPRALLPEVLALLNQINSPAYTSIVLSKLAPDFPELWPRVLETIAQIRDVMGDNRRNAKGFSYRALALTKILSDLPANYLPDAIEITRTIQDDADRASALIAMAQRLPDLWEQAIEITRTLQSDYHRASALREMAQHLPEPLWEQAIEITRTLQSDADRAIALSEMAQHLPHLWEQAIEITRTLQSDADRAIALIAMAQHLPEPLWEQAIEITRTLQSDADRAIALIAMAQHLPDLWEQAIEITRTLQSDADRASALRAMAQHLPEPLWEQAIEITRTLQSDYHRAIALIAMAQHLPEPLWEQAIEITRTLQGDYHRAIALIAMAQHLPDLWEQAIDITRTLQSDADRAIALIAMAQHLPDLWEQAIEITRTLQSDADRASALIAMAQHLPDLWEQAIEITRTLQDDADRASALREMAQHLPEPLWEQAIDITRTLQDNYNRASALIAMAQHLPELWEQAIDITRTLQDDYHRAFALREMAQHLPEPLWEQAIEITRTLQDDYHRAFALREMAQHLPEPLWEQAIEITRTLQDDANRAFALREMAQHLPEPLWEQAIEITRTLQDDADRAIALIAMAQHLPDLWEQAIDITRTLQDDANRAFALSEMAQHLPEHLWEQAIDITRTLQDDANRAFALSEMAQHLPEHLWGKTQEIIWNFSDRYYKASALSGYLPYLKKRGVTLIKWCDIINALAYQDRKQLLLNFAKLQHIIIDLSDKKTFMRTLKVIDEIHKQWP